MMSSRLPGVVKNTSLNPGDRRTGTPNTVSTINRLDHYLVTFFDELGDEHTDVLLRVGDQYYVSPFGEEWCSKLGPSRKALAAQVHRRIEAKEHGVSAEAIPVQDTVNVTGSRIIEGTKKMLEQQR